jgi:hypothetical protein
MLSAKHWSDRVAQEPRGIYRREGVTGKPNTAVVESGTLAFEISEEEYREKGYEPDFDDLPCGDLSCTTVKKDGDAHRT